MLDVNFIYNKYIVIFRSSDSYVTERNCVNVYRRANATTMDTFGDEYTTKFSVSTKFGPVETLKLSLQTEAHFRRSLAYISVLAIAFAQTV